MSKLKEELKDKIIRAIFEQTNIEDKIVNLVKGGINESISMWASHTKPRGIPADSIMDISQPEFEKLSVVTLLRRKVYKKLGISTEDVRDKMKEDAIMGTKGRKKLQFGKQIKINISNNSPLLTYLRSGKDGELARSDEKSDKEIDMIEILAEEKGFRKDNDTDLFIDKEIARYIELLYYKPASHFGKIPIRDVLRASCELIGKDFIRDNII